MMPKAAGLASLSDNYDKFLDTNDYYRKRVLESVESVLNLASLMLRDNSSPGRPCTPVFGVPPPELIGANGLLGLGGEAGRGSGVGERQFEQRQAAKFLHAVIESLRWTVIIPIPGHPVLKGMEALCLFYLLSTLTPGLLMVLVELVPVELIPDFDSPIEVWIALFGRSKGNAMVELCQQYWLPPRYFPPSHIRRCTISLSDPYQTPPPTSPCYDEFWFP